MQYLSDMLLMSSCGRRRFITFLSVFVLAARILLSLQYPQPHQFTFRSMHICIQSSLSYYTILDGQYLQQLYILYNPHILIYKSSVSSPSSSLVSSSLLALSSLSSPSSSFYVSLSVKMLDPVFFNRSMFSIVLHWKLFYLFVRHIYWPGSQIHILYTLTN